MVLHGNPAQVHDLYSVWPREQEAGNSGAVRPGPCEGDDVDLTTLMALYELKAGCYGRSVFRVGGVIRSGSCSCSEGAGGVMGAAVWLRLSRYGEKR